MDCYVSYGFENKKLHSMDISFLIDDEDGALFAYKNIIERFADKETQIKKEINMNIVSEK